MERHDINPTDTRESRRVLHQASEDRHGGRRSGGMKNVLRASVFGALLLGSISWAAPAFADSGVVPPANPNACNGRTTRYTTQDNSIAPFVSAQGIGNVGKANGAKGGGVENYIHTNVCGP